MTDKRTASMIRVDQAGEYGATRIYAGQLAVMGDRHPMAREIAHMAEQEERHRKFFDDMIAQRDPVARRGPGPFQALYRTTSMGAAARWMESHGMPPPARGVRSNGEHAMLATPEFTGGAYIGFVGPA